jgi:predicted RNA polymerase sigma factor
LLFAACHPQLPPTTQVALALRALGGLELAAIATALFCSEAALAQRLARARGCWPGRALAVPAGASWRRGANRC